MSNQDEWDVLAKAAQDGDAKAYKQLLNSIVPYIRKSLLGRLANPDWADDITQTVLLSVHKALPTYEASRSFKPWLTAIIQFRRTDFLRSYYKKRKKQEDLALSADIFGVNVTNPSHAGEYKDIERALQNLPDKQRQVFELVKIQGYTAKEAAEKMDMSESAVKVSAHRTMNKLKEQLG